MTRPEIFDDEILDALAEYRLSPGVETALAQAWNALIGNWRVTFELLGERFADIYKDAARQADKRVMFALMEGLLEFSQFVCGGEMLLLQLRQRGGQTEQALLRIEELAVDLGHRRAELVEITDACRRLSQFLGRGQRAHQGGSGA